MAGFGENMTRIKCSCCGRAFSFENDDYEYYAMSGETWYCPNCGSARHFTHKNSRTFEEFKKLQRQIRMLKSNLRYTREGRNSLYARIDKEQNRVRGLRSYITRLKRGSK